MNNSISTGISKWSKKHDLKKHQLRWPIIESYRRAYQFHNGRFDTSLLLLALPSQVKEAKLNGLIKPYSKEAARVYNWCKLTPKGIELTESLKTFIGWGKNHNAQLFTY